MDEPTGNLDASNGRHLLQLVHDLQVRTHTTFVIATHDAAVASSAQRTIHLLDGRVAADGSADGAID